jgi:DNA-binding helix-hairpin-helix protein with protein kinase domain
MSRSALPRLIDSSGRFISIKEKPLAIGGEGAVYEVVDDPSIVAKVYNSPQPRERCDKLRLMAELASPDLLKFAAWPTATLHTKSGSPVAGILMPKIVGYKEIHHLYSVAQRKKDYPEADWRFLTHAALNCAIAFERVHHHGHVVGDVNQKNVLVSNKTTVKFVDCDSFQVRAKNSTVYRCVVGVPEYTPPELQGKSFRDFDRDPNHDRFGLAVLIFHVLMMGRHPFSGVYLDAGDMPIEKAIQGGRFAYSPNVQATRMKPPPNTLPISILDANLVNLFERAFMPVGRGLSLNRPTATEWKEALQSFLKGLGACKVDPKHIFPRHSGTCPWCFLFGRTGVFFFLPGIPSLTGSGQFDLLAIWGQIERIQCPSDVYTRPGSAGPAASAPRPIPAHIPAPTPRPKLHPMPSPLIGLDTFLDRVAGVGVLVGLFLLMVAPPIAAGCLAGFGVWFLYLLSTRGQRRKAQLQSHQAEERRIRELNNQLQQMWEAENSVWCHEYKKRKKKQDVLENQLSHQESGFVELARATKDTFEMILKNLESNKDAYKEEKDAYTRDLTDLAKRSAQIQLERHLDAQLIRAAKIKKMTTAGILSLSSFGIETALDVERLRSQKVPGIGPVLTERLNEWRESLVQSFKPQPGVPTVERATVDQRHLPRLRQLESILLDGPRQLREIVGQYESRRKNLLAQIQECVDELVRARGDVEVMERLIA